LTVLEGRTLLTTNIWSGTGNWDSVGNWSQHRLPTATDDVFISAGSSVTHSAGSDTIHSLSADKTAALILSGGSITDPNSFDMPGSFTLEGGTLSGATVTSDTTITGTSSVGTLNAITLQGTLDLRTNSSSAVFSGGLTLSGGTAFLGNAAGTTFGELLPTGAAETIDGAIGHPGTITFGLSSSNSLFNGGLTGPLTLGANLTIHGTAGQIYMSNEAFDNKGTITADPKVLGTAAGTISLSGTNWTNDGTIQAQNGDNLALTGTASASPATHAWTNDAGHTIAVTGGGTLTLASESAATTADSTAWLNLGTISSNASTVDLGGYFTFKGLGTYNRTGGTVNLTGTLNNTATTLLLNTTTGSWDLSGGTVNGGTVEATAGNALVGTNSGGTLSGITLNSSGGNTSPLDMQTNVCSINVSGGLTLSGVTIFLGNAAGTTFGELLPTGAAETIDGASGRAGTITFGLNSSNSLLNGGLTGTLTLGANLTIHGTAGQIYMNNEAFDNKGTITADPKVLNTAAGTISLSGTNWTNDGTIQAQNGDNLTLTGTAAASPATHAWTNDAGHTIAVTGGGTLALASESAATTADSTAWLNLGTINSNASTVDLGGYFTFKGLSTYNRTGGTVNLTGTLNNTATTLLLNTTTGSWDLSGGTVNGGTVEATAGNALVGTNYGGTLSGVTLNSSGGNTSPFDTRTNVSEVKVSGGLTLSGVTIFLGNAAGTTFGELTPTGAAETVDGAIGHPGTITFGLSDSNGLYNVGSSGLLTLGANLTIDGTAGQIYMSNEAFDNKGTITADPKVLGTAAGIISLSGTNWTNDGTIQAQNGDNLALTGTAAVSPATHAWTNDAGHTIAVTGGGTLTLASESAATTADSTAWLNLGTISSNASTVDLGGYFTLKGLGTYNRTGGTVNLTGTLNNTATTLLLNTSTGSWDLSGGKVNGGTVEATAGNALVGTNYGGTLSGVTLNSSGGNTSPLDMQTNVCSINVSGGLTLSGVTIFLGNAAGTTFGELLPNGAAETIDGASGEPGTITFGLSGSNGLYSEGLSGLLTLGANLTINGTAGDINTGSQAFINKGTITADPKVRGTAAGIISLNGTNWTNTGTIAVQNSDTIYAGGTISNLSANTLTGGTWKVFANSTLMLDTANSGSSATLNNLNANAATLVLDGANSNVINPFTDTDALAGFDSNLAAGNLTVQDGRTLNTPAFTNAGTVLVGTGGTISVASGSNYTQTGGTTTISGVLKSAGTGNFNLNAGKLLGNGTATFTGVTNSGGQLDPGLPATAGKLTITGNYTQNAGGSLNIRINGTTAGQFDQLAVSKVATLGGTLDVALNCCPGAGNAFQFMTFGSRSGDFAAKQLPTLGGGLTMTELTSTTSATLNVSSPATTTVTNVNSTTANGAYGAGATITITVCFSRVVTVTGAPHLALNSGGTATYTSGSGTSTLTFTYVVAAGQNSSDLDYTSTTALTLNGGTITDSQSKAASLTLAAPGAATSLGANKNIIIDTTAPKVSNVTSPTANGTYGIGATITITITFSEVVTVTGAPDLALNSGGTAKYNSGSGTNTLTFTYVVAVGQNSSDLDYTSTTALTLNGGTIKDLAGNAATLTLAAPGAAGSLGANKNIVIKT
jgi:hypothetical protein